MDSPAMPAAPSVFIDKRIKTFIKRPNRKASCRIATRHDRPGTYKWIMGPHDRRLDI